MDCVTIPINSSFFYLFCSFFVFFTVLFYFIYIFFQLYKLWDKLHIKINCVANFMFFLLFIQFFLLNETHISPILTSTKQCSLKFLIKYNSTSYTPKATRLCKLISWKVVICLFWIVSKNINLTLLLACPKKKLKKLNVIT